MTPICTLPTTYCMLPTNMFLSLVCYLLACYLLACYLLPCYLLLALPTVTTVGFPYPTLCITNYPVGVTYCYLPLPTIIHCCLPVIVINYCRLPTTLLLVEAVSEPTPSSTLIVITSPISNSR